MISGQNFLDAGKIHAPYIPMQSTPTLLGPPEPTIIERTAALDEENGGPARKMIAEWEEHKRLSKKAVDEIRHLCKQRKIVMRNMDFFAKCDMTNLSARTR